MTAQIRGPEAVHEADCARVVKAVGLPTHYIDTSAVCTCGASDAQKVLDKIWARVRTRIERRCAIGKLEGVDALFRDSIDPRPVTVRNRHMGFFALTKKMRHHVSTVFLHGAIAFDPTAKEKHKVTTAIRCIGDVYRELRRLNARPIKGEKK